MHGFLGLTGYYHRFVKGYAAIASPLTDLLKKEKYVWTKAATTAFVKLKEAMSKTPVLMLPDFHKSFVIEADASGTGIGAVLMQDGHPISYFSKKLCAKMQLASTYIKELHVIIEAIGKWRQYLIGRNFVVRTDHKSIKELLLQPIHTPEQQKYIRKLLGYEFRIEYKPGFQIWRLILYRGYMKVSWKLKWENST